MFRMLATSLVNQLAVYISGCRHTGNVSTDDPIKKDVPVKLVRRTLIC